MDTEKPFQWIIISLPMLIVMGAEKTFNGIYSLLMRKYLRILFPNPAPIHLRSLFIAISQVV